jgi:hypothetical protein
MIKLSTSITAPSRLVMNGCTLVCNQPSLQTQPLFEVTPNAFIEFSHVKFPGNKYQFQNGVEVFRTFVEGDGYVIGTACIADIASGAGNIPLHKSLNPTRNFGFGTGDLSSWSFNNQGSVSQTCVVDAAYKKDRIIWSSHDFNRVIKLLSDSECESYRAYILYYVTLG